jgi:hypothetical protein
MKEYTLWDRMQDNGIELAEEEALDIARVADMHSGAYGGMGKDIKKVIYSQEGDNEPVIFAVHYKSYWLTIPDNQNEFMSFELSQNDFEEE